MRQERIAELLVPFLVSPLAQFKLNNISTYIDLLLRWNARINLTSVRDLETILTRHFGESLFAARHLFAGAPSLPGFGKGGSQSRNVPDLLDFGSGAGFPGVPIKIWAPQLRVTLVESNQKKATFLREVARALTLTDINVFSARAETLSVQASVVTLRAVERFDQSLPIASRLVAPGGRLALLIGQRQVERARDILPSFGWLDPIPIPASTERILLVGNVARPEEESG